MFNNYSDQQFAAIDINSLQLAMKCENTLKNVVIDNSVFHKCGDFCPASVNTILNYTLSSTAYLTLDMNKYVHNYNTLSIKSKEEKEYIHLIHNNEIVYYIPKYVGLAFSETLQREKHYVDIGSSKSIQSEIDLEEVFKGFEWDLNTDVICWLDFLCYNNNKKAFVTSIKKYHDNKTLAESTIVNTSDENDLLKPQCGICEYLQCKEVINTIYIDVINHNDNISYGMK